MHFLFPNGFLSKSTTNGCIHPVRLHFLWQWKLEFMITWPMRLTLSIYSETGYRLANNVQRLAFPSAFNLHRSKHSFGTVFRHFGFHGAGSCSPRHSVAVKIYFHLDSRFYNKRRFLMRKRYLVFIPLSDFLLSNGKKSSWYDDVGT